MSLKGNIEAEALNGQIQKLLELRGYSAYEIALKNGFKGTEEEWLASLKADFDEEADEAKASIFSYVDETVVPGAVEEINTAKDAAKTELEGASEKEKKEISEYTREEMASARDDAIVLLNEEANKFASHILMTPDENGRVYLEFGKKYKVFADAKTVDIFESAGGGTQTIYDCYVEQGFYSGGILYRSYHTNQDASSYYDVSSYLAIDDTYSEFFTMRVLDMCEGVEVGSNAVTVDVIYELEKTDKNGALVLSRRKDQIHNVADPKDITGEYAFVEGAKAVYLCNSDLVLEGVNGEDGESAFIRYSANADGTDFAEEWSEERNYIGFATGKEAPTDKSGYQWIPIAESSGTDLLWENASPGSVFPATSFIIPGAEAYTEFFVLCRLRASSARYTLGGVIVKDVGSKVYLITGTAWAARNADAQTVEGGVKFSFSLASLYQCRTATLTVNYENYCIPYRIYGVKRKV